METEPPNAVEIEPANGFLNSEGLASLKFRRISSSLSMGRINCKVVTWNAMPLIIFFTQFALPYYISWHMNQDVTNDQVNPRKIWESILIDTERVL